MSILSSLVFGTYHYTNKAEVIFCCNIKNIPILIVATDSHEEQSSKLMILLKTAFNLSNNDRYCWYCFYWNVKLFIINWNLWVDFNWTEPLNHNFCYIFAIRLESITVFNSKLCNSNDMKFSKVFRLNQICHTKFTSVYLLWNVHSTEKRIKTLMTFLEHQRSSMYIFSEMQGKLYEKNNCCLEIHLNWYGNWLKFI